MPTTRLVEWNADDQTFEGLLALPDGDAKGAVLICHAWGGRHAHEEEFAAKLAGLGYIAMAGDVYGKGVRGNSNEENQALMNPLASDRPRLLVRLQAALDALASQPEVDAERVAAAGFCFGGLSVLDLARANAAVQGVAAFHAIVAGNGEGGDPIKPKVIAFQGFDDPMAGPEDLKNFGMEMTERQADWQLHSYGSVSHAFTNAHANQPENGLIFDATARDRSYQAFENFLSELFG
ncbi:MAG: dienelactone hydrolase family protein [Parvularculaceae bacterium]|nr:dienelactone hydrolase family protein [Parvularculaceae bacterium]